MKEKMIFGIIGGISIIATGIPVYNYYILPVIRHKEMMDKIDGFEKRLTSNLLTVLDLGQSGDGPA